MDAESWSYYLIDEFQRAPCRKPCKPDTAAGGDTACMVSKPDSQDTYERTA